MKFKVTKKEMVNVYNKILGSGYCTLQYLLQYQTPIAYSAGVNGWNCDYYNIDNILISTGYGPINSKNMISDYDIIKEYEIKAQKIINSYTDDIVNKEYEINLLLIDLLDKLTIK